MSIPPVLTSPLLQRQAGVRHAFFTRRGGVSTGVYASLNVGVGSRDDPDSVLENRARAAAAFGAPPERLLTCYQIHSAIAVVADGPWTQRPEADAVASGAPGLVLGALSADCAPVLLADAEAGVVAAVHAGWRGTVAGVLPQAIERMHSAGAPPDSIAAAIGPTISPDYFEVGPEVAAAFAAADLAPAIIDRPGQKPHIDLQRALHLQLARAGITHIDAHTLCTHRDAHLFLSHRRENGRTGRMAAAIAAKQNP